MRDEKKRTKRKNERNKEIERGKGEWGIVLVQREEEREYREKREGERTKKVLFDCSFLDLSLERESERKKEEFVIPQIKKKT